MKQSSTLRNYAARLRTQADKDAAQPKRRGGAPKGNKNALGHHCGRPPKIIGGRLNSQITVRLSDSERAKLDIKAAAAGLSSADFIRHLISL